MLFCNNTISLTHSSSLYEGERPAVTPEMHAAVTEAKQEGSNLSTQPCSDQMVRVRPSPLACCNSVMKATCSVLSAELS